MQNSRLMVMYFGPEHRDKLSYKSTCTFFVRKTTVFMFLLFSQVTNTLV